MPNVDTNAPLVTNSDAAMWRQDHASAIRYIEALLAERETWAPVIEAAKTLRFTQDYDDTEEALEALDAAIDAALKEGNTDG